MQKLVTTALVLAAAGSAYATTLAPGDFVFTRSNGTNDSALDFFDWDTDTITELVYDGPGRQLGALDMDDSGNFYSVDHPIPLGVPSQSNIYKFASGPLFSPLGGGAQASFSNVVSAGGDIRRPGEGVWDAASNQVIYANNNANLGADPNSVHAVLGVDVTTGAQTRIVEETNLDIFNNIPNFLQLSGITESPSQAFNHVFSSPNGGRIVGTGTAGVGSTLWGLNGTGAGGTETFIKDFTDNDVIADLGRELTFVGTIANIPGTNDLLIADAGFADGVTAGGVYRVELDDATGAYVGISKVLDASDYADLGAAGDIVYNEFTGRWILANLEFNGLGLNQILSFDLADPAGSLIVEADNIRAGNFVVVPTPGAAAMLGLAGLAGLRRRRA